MYSIASTLHLQTCSSYSKCYLSFLEKGSQGWDVKWLAQSHERNLLEPGLNERFQFPSVTFKSLGFTLLIHLSLKGTKKPSWRTLKTHIRTVRARIKHTSCRDLGLYVYGSPDVAHYLVVLCTACRVEGQHNVNNSSKCMSCSICSESPSKISLIWCSS